MTKKQAVNAPKAPQAVGPYSHAVRIGDLLFCSGQIPIDPEHPETSIAIDVQGQTRQVLENMKRVLESEGLSLDHVVKTTVFMTNLDDFAQMNEIYAEFFQEPYPARSTIQVSALPKSSHVEIEAVAHY